MDDLKSLIPVSYDNPERPTVSGRELHDFLEVTTRYNDWFNRMTEYGFTEGEDYYSFLSNRSDGLAGKPRTDHQLTIPMAKELCMIQRNERGKQARQYFLAVEAQWNSPEVRSVLERTHLLATENSVTKHHSLGVFCFETPFIWWPKIRPPKITAQFCVLVHKPLHIRRGCPQFWGDPEHHGDAAGMFFTRVHLRDLTKMLTSTKSQTAQSPQTVTAHV